MKFCSNCGCQVDDGTTYCPNCGAQQEVAVQQYRPGGAAVKIPAKRGLLKLILFTFLTFGIYPLVVYTKISCEINTIASPYDGKKTMNYLLVAFIFSVLTLGIVPIVWIHRLCNRMGNELSRRGIGYSFGAGTFWGWGVLGSIIVIGPFVYCHKFFKAMNLLAADYNAKGC